MSEDNEILFRSIIHKLIIGDLFINGVLFLLEIAYTYQALFGGNSSDITKVSTGLFLLILTIVLLSYDIIYLYRKWKGDMRFDVSRVLASASVFGKLLLLFLSLLVICFIGPSEFFSMFDMFF